MAKRGPHPKLGKMEPPSYTLCETVPDPPEWLPDIGRAEWMEKAGELYARGLLTTVCLAPLAIYCDAYASYRKLSAYVCKNGVTYSNNRGWEAPRPEVSLQTQKGKFMMVLAKEFGFTPSSQSRIAIVPQRDEAAERDPVEAARQALQRLQGMRTNSPASLALEPRLKRLP